MHVSIQRRVKVKRTSQLQGIKNAGMLYRKETLKYVDLGDAPAPIFED